MIEIATTFLVVQTNQWYYNDRFYIYQFPPFQNAFLDSLMILWLNFMINYIFLKIKIC